MNFHFQITNNDFWPYATKKALLNTPFLFFYITQAVHLNTRKKNQNGNLRLDLNYHTSCCFCTQL